MLSQCYMTETRASTNSDTAGEFFSYDDMWMNYSEEAQLESNEEFLNDGDNNIEKEFGGFDDIGKGAEIREGG